MELVKIAQSGDWSQVAQVWPLAAAMQSCVQDAEYHAEGDVFTHTRMVCQSLNLMDHSFWATALYHDVAKPETRQEVWEQGVLHVQHPDHSRRGAHVWWTDAQQQEWLSTAQRSYVWFLIRYHQRPFHAWKSADMMRFMAAMAVDVNIYHLIAFAQADNAGRKSVHQAHTQEQLDLLQEWCTEHHMLNLFQTDHHRVTYFENAHRHIDYVPPEPTGSKVVIMSGLPGSGKDTHVNMTYPHTPVVSLDDVRRTLKISATDNQGQVIQAAQEQVRIHLRKGESFVWNATCITRQQRQKIIQLCRSYDAHVTVVEMTTPWTECVHRNRNRMHQVPDHVLQHMLHKQEPVSLTECHQLIRI